MAEPSGNELSPAGGLGSRAQRLAGVSILVALGVFGIKWVAYRWTGSAALYSDALENLVNVVTAAGAWFAVRVARRPPDEQHPFGHHKAEDIAAGFVGAVVLVTALQVVRVALPALAQPRDLERVGDGLLVASLAGGVNLGWALVLLRRGRALDSPALRADGLHLMSDVVSSLGVVVGLLLADRFGAPRLDPILALLVAASIVVAGWRLVRGSASRLLDETPDEATASAIRVAIAASAGGALEFHDLRARRSGRRVFVEFHLVVDGDSTVREAHDICDRIEEAVRASLPGTEVLIHLEPDERAEGRTGGASLLSGDGLSGNGAAPNDF